MADATVKVYSTPTCAFCKTEKQWLDSIGVSYVTRDIEEDDGAQEELLTALDGNFRGVPTTIIGDDVIVGFDMPKLKTALETNGLLAS